MMAYGLPAINFNPRSLAGATDGLVGMFGQLTISIHAPLRERHSASQVSSLYNNFNPRSLAGATIKDKRRKVDNIFQSTLPCGSDFGGS